MITSSRISLHKIDLSMYGIEEERKSFIDFLRSNYQGIPYNSTRNPNYRKVLICKFGDKKFRIYYWPIEPKYPPMRMYFSSPTFTFIRFFESLLKKFNSTYNLSYAEIPFDLYTTHPKELFLLIAYSAFLKWGRNSWSFKKVRKRKSTKGGKKPDDSIFFRTALYLNCPRQQGQAVRVYIKETFPLMQYSFHALRLNWLAYKWRS